MSCVRVVGETCFLIPRLNTGHASPCETAGAGDNSRDTALVRWSQQRATGLATARKKDGVTGIVLADERGKGLKSARWRWAKQALRGFKHEQRKYW